MTRVKFHGDSVPVRGMKQISLKQLPEEALRAIQEEADLPLPPTALSAKRRRGAGFPRWLVETDADTWRVATVGQNWMASLDA